MNSPDRTLDVVIVGAGIAGSALAISLARAGYSVLMLEKSTVHVDRVRGEFIVPWGVAEARTLGILDLLEGAGGNYTVRSVPYGEDVAPEIARKFALRMDQMVEGVRGALNLGHPRICNVLNAAAVEAGAVLMRGVNRIEVSAGLPPKVEFECDGASHTVTPRVVIGADGRGSTVARQAGFARLSDPLHHILTGLLIDDAHDWPHDEQSIGVDGDIGFYVFPQGGGRIRLYAAHGETNRIVILGFFRAASALLSQIERQNESLLEQITVIDFNPNVFRILNERGVHVIYGDISNVDTLVHAGIGKAEIIILSVPDSLLVGANNEKLVRHAGRQIRPVETTDLRQIQGIECSEKQRVRELAAWPIIAFTWLGPMETFATWFHWFARTMSRPLSMLSG